MKGCFQRVLGLLLVLTTAAWSHAVCPLMLFPQTESCGNQQKPNASSAHHQKSEHDCCPRTRHSQQREPAQLSNCSRANTDCCSVECEPANPTKAVLSLTTDAVVGRVMASELYVASQAQLLESADASAPTRGVLSLKEDLRI